MLVKACKGGFCKQLVVAGQKSGWLWALNPENGAWPPGCDGCNEHCQQLSQHTTRTALVTQGTTLMWPRAQTLHGCV